ncbi:hypothetical protein D3C78_928060 [compost metagenome]
MAADRIDDGCPALLGQWFARLGQGGAIDDFAGPQLLQVIVLRGASGGRDHPVAEPAQQGDGETADATVGAGHQNFALFRRYAIVLKGKNTQHGRVARRTDGHRLGRGKRLGQRNQPVTVQASLLRQSTPMPFTHAPAIEQDLVTDLVVRMPADFDDTGQVDARHHREFTHHRTAAGDRQAILEVQRAVGNTHRDITLGQLIVLDLLQCGPITAVVFVDQNAFEHDGLSMESVWWWCI